jgi:nitroreductase
MSTRNAQLDHPVHDLIAHRWSPYAFADRAVSDDDLRSVFEAARWAPSSYNEQPWSYIVATKQQQPAEFERVLSCLVAPNQEWAKAAPVLALGITTLNFSRNNKPNRAAYHDLGLAAGNLVTEATARGLAVHQMIGIYPDRARMLFQIPRGTEALTGLAIGYAGAPDTLSDKLRERDLATRTRKPLDRFVFTGTWGTAAPFTPR